MHEIIRVFHVFERVIAHEHRAAATTGPGPDGRMTDRALGLGAGAYTDANCPKPDPSDQLNGWVESGYYLDMEGTLAPGADWFTCVIEDRLGPDGKIDDTLIVINFSLPRSERRLSSPG